MTQFPIKTPHNRLLTQGWDLDEVALKNEAVAVLSPLLPLSEQAIPGRTSHLNL